MIMAIFMVLYVLIMPETLYHATTIDRAERCLEEGLVPYLTTLSRPETLKLDMHYDSVRPSNVVERGLTRLGSVYAHLGLSEAVSRRNGGWLNHYTGKIAVLAIQISDPTKVFVADGLLNVAPHIPEEYWASVMSLQAYRDQEQEGKPVFQAPCWFEKHNLLKPDQWDRYIYMWPEALIPGGVEPAAVSLVPDELIHIDKLDDI